MSNRALILGESERAAIRAAIERAALRPVPLATIERIAEAVPQGSTLLTLDDVPPDAPRIDPGEHVRIPMGYRAAISFEHQPCGLCRHLSVSIDVPGKLPHMLAVGVIAEAFGFVRGVERQIWIEEFEPGLHAVNVVEPVLAPSTETNQ